MTRRDQGKAWKSSLGCVYQVNILLHAQLAIRKKLCKHVSFYSPWYFPFVFLERFPSLQSHCGCIWRPKWRDRLWWLEGVSATVSQSRRANAGIRSMPWDGSKGNRPGQDGMLTTSHGSCFLTHRWHKALTGTIMLAKSLENYDAFLGHFF